MSSRGIQQEQHLEHFIIVNMIASDPQVRGGRPCLAGTGLRVIDIVMARQFLRRTPSEIAAEYDISLAQTHAALNYYSAHKDELDEDMLDQIALARTIREMERHPRSRRML